MNRRLIFSVLFFVFMLPIAAASAKTVDQNALILELQREIEDLTRQVQALQRQLSATQSELGVVSAAIGSEAPSASVATTTTAIAPPELTRALSRGASGDDVRKLQEFLAQDKEIYPAGLITGFFGPLTEAALKKWQNKHDIEALGVAGPKTIAKLKERGREAVQGFLEQGAGVSGIAPSGTPLTSGSGRFLGTTSATTTPAALAVAAVASAAATTTSAAATTSPALLCARDPRYCATKEACTTANFSWYAVSCHKDPPLAYSCASSYNYCVSPAECSAQGWYSCRNSCYGSLDACQGQSYVPPAQAAAIPALPATPAQPVAQTGTTTAPAIPATSATTTAPSSTSTTSPPSTSLPLSSSATDACGTYGVSLYESLYGKSPFSSGKQDIYFVQGNTKTLITSDDYSLDFGIYPDIICSGDSFGVVWTDARVNTVPAYFAGLVFKDQLYFKKLDRNGQSLTTEIQLTQAAAKFGNRPSVAWTGTEYGIVWADDRDWRLEHPTIGSSGEWEVYFIRVSASGTKITAEKRITNCVDSKSCYPKDLSWNPAGYYDLTYGEWSGGSPEAVHSMKLDIGIAADITPPVLSAIQAINIAATSTVITWTTNEQSDSQVEYGVSTSYGSQTALDGTRVTSHSAALSGLTASTAYHYRVKSKDTAGNQAASGDQMFTTAAPQASLPAPLSMRWNWVGRTTSPAAPTQNYQLIIYYSPSAIDAPASFNIYLKKPGESGFTKTNYQKSSLMKYVASSGSEASYSAYPLGNYGVPSDSIPLGEYKVYATAVDSAGIETAPTPTATGNYNAAPLIANPANGSAKSSLAQIDLSNRSSLANPRYIVSLYGANGYIWAPNAFYGSSVTYNGPVLSSANNPHTLVAGIFPSGIDPADSSPYTVNTFNIASAATTSSFLDTRAKNIAAIAQALDAIKEQLLKLLQGL